MIASDKILDSWDPWWGKNWEPELEFETPLQVAVEREFTYVLKVAGGWLYRQVNIETGLTTAMTFVPFPDKPWVGGD